MVSRWWPLPSLTSAVTCGAWSYLLGARTELRRGGVAGTQTRGGAGESDVPPNEPGKPKTPRRQGRQGPPSLQACTWRGISGCAGWAVCVCVCVSGGGFCPWKAGGRQADDVCGCVPSALCAVDVEPARHVVHPAHRRVCRALRAVLHPRVHHGRAPPPLPAAAMADHGAVRQARRRWRSGWRVACRRRTCQHPCRWRSRLATPGNRAANCAARLCTVGATCPHRQPLAPVGVCCPLPTDLFVQPHEHPAVGLDFGSCPNACSCLLRVLANRCARVIRMSDPVAAAGGPGAPAACIVGRGHRSQGQLRPRA